MTTQFGLDHFVLVARDVETTVEFYRRTLDAHVRDLDAWRQGRAEYPVLHFGSWKVNVHPVTTPATPRASSPVPGAADFCLRWAGTSDAAIQRLTDAGCGIELGPIEQEGALGTGQSVYFRDPDGCLVELICYPPGAAS